MFRAIGFNTNKEYMNAETKSELLRLLHQKYPATNKAGAKGREVPCKFVYSEPLIITSERSESVER